MNNQQDRRKSVRRLTTTSLLAASVAVGALSLGTNSATVLSMPLAHAEAVRVDAPAAPSFADVVSAVSPAVVSVRVEQAARQASDDRGFGFDRRFPGNPDDLPPFFRNNPDFFERFFGNPGGRDDQRGERRNPRRFGMSQGSGFFISEDGYVVTNNHVIDGGTKFVVVMDDGTEHEATLVGSDDRSDLAVLKVDAEEKFTYVAFSDVEPRIGDWVVAVGNPFGLGGTVTAGIVSARGREIGANRYDDFIQIDAAVNKGNSGGPAFDLNGGVIGINTAIFSPSGGNVGIAFAIPASTARDVVDQLISKGQVIRGWLGVQIQPLSDDIADAVGLKDARGAMVTEPQADSPAAAAGIRAGDVITAVDGKAVKNPRELARVIAGYTPESTVTLDVWRDGASKEFEVKLGKLEPQQAAAELDEQGDAAPETTPRLGLALGMAPDGEGVMVMEVLPESPAAEKGIEAGDIVASVNGEKVEKPEDVARLVGEVEKSGRKSTLLQIRREGNSRFVAVPFDKG